MKKLLIGLVILSIFLAASLLDRAFAQEHHLAVSTENAIILFLEGDVKVKGLTLKDWVEAAAGMVLSRGDSIKTGAASWVEIGFGEDLANVVRIKENTFVELIELGPIKVGLLKGEVRSLVEALARDSTFEIKTPTAVCGSRGTGWDTNTDGRRVVVDAYEDEVFFYALDRDGNPVMDDPTIESGKRGVMEDPSKPISIEDLPLDRLMDWQRWREDFTERMGIREGIREKVEKTEQIEDTAEDLTKGKEGVFEKKDQDKIDKRLETPRTSGSSD